MNANVKKPTALVHPGAVWRTHIEDTNQTQTQVAEKMGASVAGLSRILRRAGVPSAPFTIKFAEAVDASVEELWQGVADFQLAQALAAHKPVKVVKILSTKASPAKAPTVKAPAKRAAKKVAAK